MSIILVLFNENELIIVSRNRSSELLVDKGFSFNLLESANYFGNLVISVKGDFFDKLPSSFSFYLIHSWTIAILG